MYGVLVFLGILFATLLGFAVITTIIDIFDERIKDNGEKHEEKEEKK